MTGHGGSVGRGRLIGIDAARALALAGMFAMHLLPLLRPDGTHLPLTSVVSGKASALFAVLAGVGVALCSRNAAAGGRVRSPFGDRVEFQAAAAAVLARAVSVGAIGLVLHFAFRPPAEVILIYYALAFPAAIPVLRLRAAALFALAAAWCCVSPVLSHLLRAHLPAVARHGVLGYLVTYSLAGSYPALLWVTYLLVGLAVGRLALHRAAVARALLVGGSVLALAARAASELLLGPLGGATALGLPGELLQVTRRGTTPTDSWWWLAVAAPHSGTPFDLAFTSGTSLFMVGLCLLLARRLPRCCSALAVVGSIPLTLYVAHLAVLGLQPREAAGGPRYLALQLAGAALVAAGLHRAGRRGPLEALCARVSGWARDVVLANARVVGAGFPKMDDSPAPPATHDSSEPSGGCLSDASRP